ncbi:hypothetical protein Tco_1244579, partial [Tanacetum coccineum]
HAEFDESETYVLERFYTAAGNPVKEILLKLNLPDHRSILMDSKVTLTNHGRMTKPYSSPRFIANYFISEIFKDGDGDCSTSDYLKEKMLLMQAQENGVDLDEEWLLFLTADQCDAFDSDVDEAPTAQTMFKANLSSANPVYNEAGPSYNSNTLSEVQDHDNCLDNMNDSHEEHEMHNGDNEDQVVHSDVSSVPNDALMIITNDIYEHDAQCVTSNDTVNASLTVELARYKELAESFYDEVNRVAIGYKNPFYLSKAKQVQPALYNGHEIIKTNHARALVHDSEDTLEIAETTRKQIIDKMKDPEYVKKKVKIAPHDYSKENYLETFTPHKQLTPEQIFWSDDLKIKAKDLK